MFFLTLRTDAEKHLAGHGVHVCAAGTVHFLCLAAFDFIDDP